MQGREERFAHWADLLKTISSIRPDILTALLPLMLKDTDSPIVEDIEEILAQAEKAQQEQAQAESQSAQEAKQLEVAKTEASIQKDVAQAHKLQSQAQMLSESTKQMAQNGEIDAQARGKLQISPSDQR